MNWVVVCNHCLESDYGTTKVQIILAGRSPRLTQWPSNACSSRLRAWGMQFKSPENWKGKDKEKRKQKRRISTYYRSTNASGSIVFQVAVRKKLEKRQKISNNYGWSKDRGRRHGMRSGKGQGGNKEADYKEDQIKWRRESCNPLK